MISKIQKNSKTRRLYHKITSRDLRICLVNIGNRNTLNSVVKFTFREKEYFNLFALFSLISHAEPS